MRTILLFFTLAVAITINNHAQAQQPISAIGTLKCSSCDLKKSNGAKAQCSVYGCQYSFKTENATDVHGKYLKQFRNKTYNILLNDNSQALATKENKGKLFVLQGKIYHSDGVIEVESFKLKTDK